MHSVSVKRVIDAPIEEIWRVLDDFGGVAKYNPHVETSRIIAGPPRGEGATRECSFNDGGRVEEEIIDYVPQTGYTVNFTDVGEFPLEENVVEIGVESMDKTRTVVTMTSTFTPKYGPVGWIMAKVMMQSKFRKTFEDVLDGLDAYIHTQQNPPLVE